MARKNRVLIVEDNADVRELMVLYLRRAGYEIAEAATGLAALEQAHVTHPDLIIMDLGLPGMTGDEATVRLKADPSTKDIPVIVNTAFHPGSSNVNRAIAAGAAEILHKPTDFQTLLESVQRYSSVIGEGTSNVRESEGSPPAVAHA
jgi:two-component system, cell cycle response regulator DivK